MDTVNFLSLLWGLSLIMICFGFLIRPKHIATLFAAAEDQATLLLMAIVSIILGIASVLTYNVWSRSWEVVITILGWLVIIKGLLILYAPETAMMLIEKVKQKSAQWMPIKLVAGIILGCLLIYLGLPT